MIAASSIYWTDEVTEALSKPNGLQEYLKVCSLQIEDIVTKVGGCINLILLMKYNTLLVLIHSILHISLHRDI